jgi:hypothetical protein
MDRERSIFPALLNQSERLLLEQLSSESGLSKSAVLRRLLYKEFSTRQLTSTKPQALPVKGSR